MCDFSGAMFIFRDQDILPFYLKKTMLAVCKLPHLQKKSYY